MKIQEYLIDGALNMFNIQLKEAENNLPHTDYAQECLKKMTEMYQDMLLFEQLGLIESEKSISSSMSREVKGLENKLMVIRN